MHAPAVKPGSHARSNGEGALLAVAAEPVRASGGGVAAAAASSMVSFSSHCDARVGALRTLSHRLVSAACALEGAHACRAGDVRRQSAGECSGRSDTGSAVPRHGASRAGSARPVECVELGWCMRSGQRAWVHAPPSPAPHRQNGNGATATHAGKEVGARTLVLLQRFHAFATLPKHRVRLVHTRQAIQLPVV